MKLAAILLLPVSVWAHDKIKADPSDTWQVRHMKEEHGIADFDAHSFFTLHDNDNSKTWTRTDILNLYGLLKPSEVGDGTGGGEVGESHEYTNDLKDKVYNEVMKLLDTNNDGVVSIDEWREFCSRGEVLPDFGLGPGHHGDYEFEYEVHHWREHHAENDPEVKIRHPEDDEHDRLYHAFEHGDSEADPHDGSWIQLSRVPVKFRKQHKE